MNDTIYFYLPGLVEGIEVFTRLVERMKLYPEHFYDNIKIGGIYGCPPGAIWNGGRCMGGSITEDETLKMIQMINELNIPIRYTWTNPCMTKEDLDDNYCNQVMEWSKNYPNEVLVNTELFENFIREKYPQFTLISSTTKRITGLAQLNEELKKDYKLVVVDYDFNNNWDLLKQIEHPEKCEILINAVCNPKCKLRKEHYQILGHLQKQEFVEFNEDFMPIMGCQAQFRIYTDIKALPTFVSKEDLYNKYVPAGFHHFKIEGRSRGIYTPIRVLYWILYYMVKPEYQDEERGALEQGIDEGVLSPRFHISY